RERGGEALEEGGSAGPAGGAGGPADLPAGDPPMSAPERAADAELKLEAVIQKLESSVLTSGEGKSLTIRGSSEDAPPTRLPARIREIVAENLSAQESPGRAVAYSSPS
ncbi:ciliary rootlet coiled-coil, rootletin, partial [Chelydra serpentina]